MSRRRNRVNPTDCVSARIIGSGSPKQPQPAPPGSDIPDCKQPATDAAYPNHAPDLKLVSNSIKLSQDPSCGYPCFIGTIRGTQIWRMADP